MKVRNLVDWAGPNWKFEVGEVIELDDKTAKTRIKAGLAEKVDQKRESTQEA